MNEQTEKMIRELAEKLGTTTEHLWGVLLAQAPVAGVWSAMAAMGYVIGAVLVTIIAYKVVRHLWEVEREEVLAWFTGVVCLIWFVICCIGFSSYIYDAVTAFYNPEYWALQNILKELK